MYGYLKHLELGLEAIYINPNQFITFYKAIDFSFYFSIAGRLKQPVSLVQRLKLKSMPINTGYNGQLLL